MTPQPINASTAGASTAGASTAGASTAGASTAGASLDRTIERFDVVERVVHLVNGALFIVLLITAACLYVPELSSLVGRRYVIENIHVYSGLALPLPILAAVVLRRRGTAFRRDLGRLNRWSGDDWTWMRSVLASRASKEDLRSTLRLGKFNPGQKLNAAFTGGAILVMLITGSVMYWYRLWPLSWRTGATFVHDWIALGLALTVTGHIYLAMNDPDALASIRTGRISRRWAQRHAPRWLDGMDAPSRDNPDRDNPDRDDSD